jgi:membrane protease YdiL (CAAX protease family)
VWTPLGWQCLVWTPHGWQWALWTAYGWQLPPPMGWPPPGWSPWVPDPRLARYQEAPHDHPTPYPELLRTPRVRPWHPLVGVLLLLVAWIAIGIAIFAVAAAAVAIIDDPSVASQDELDELTGPLGFLVGNLFLAAAIPAALVAVAVVHGERPGWLNSVTRRLRPRLLLVCAGLALAVQALAAAVFYLLYLAGADMELTDSETEWPGSRTFLALLLITLLTTPLQSAGEEYVFRGYLIQAGGVWTRSRWIPGLVSSLLFAAAHGAQDPWLFADRFFFGLAAWWLVLRTGGLEAGIALHAVNNVVVFIFAAASDEIDSSLEATDMEAWVALLDVAMIVLTAYLCDRYARRARVATTSVPAVDRGP